MKISFTPKSGEAAKKVAQWTRVVSGEDTPIKPNSSEPNADEPDALRWLTQVLELALALLQAARVPVFDPIAVLNCQPQAPQAPQWVSICQHPAPTILPLSRLMALILEAFTLADWASEANLESARHREEFFTRIQVGAFKVLAFNAPTGKSTFEVLRVAHRLSIPYRPLVGGVFQLGWGRRARLIHRSTTDHDSAIGLHLTRDKRLTAHMLRQAGLPAPEHQPASSLAQAQSWAQRIGYPLVVKPSDMERGEGVSVDVTEAGLEAAFQSAQKISRSKSVLIERQVPGVCHRLFITQGQLLYAVKRLPMGVYGDGTSSIGELAQAAHAAQMQRPPWMRSGVSSLHPLPLAFLQQQGWSATDVPAAGQFVALRRIESTAWGGVDEDVTHTVHPDNVSAAIRAAHLLGLEVAGVDLISTDITQAWHSNGAVINEVNYAPLLGGGEISRSHIPTYLSRMLKHQGKIPIETIHGGEDAWAQGLEHQQRWIAMGEAAFLTDHRHTLDPQGRTYPMATYKLHERVQALLMNQEVGALVVVPPNKTPRQ